MATPTTGTIPALPQYGTGGLALATTVAIEIVDTASATTAVSYRMSQHDFVGKAPGIMTPANPSASDVVGFLQVSSNIPKQTTIGNLGIPSGNLPTGGIASSVLQKLSTTNFDAGWTPWVPRETLNADRTYYVSTTGSDSNDGLSLSTPFLTIQNAFYVFMQLELNNFGVTIQLVDGTYTAGGASFIPFNGYFTVRGNAADASAVKVTGPSADSGQASFTFWSSGGAECFLYDMEISNDVPTGECIHVAFGTFLTYGNIRWGACGLNQIDVDTSAVVVCESNYSIIGSAGSHVSSTLGGLWQRNGGVCTLIGTPHFDSFVYCDSSGVVQSLGGASYSGSATGLRFDLDNNGCVMGSGAGSLTLFPGNSAGTMEEASTYGQLSGITGAPSVKTADFTVGNSGFWFFNNKAATTCVATLPAASALVGRELRFKNSQALPLASSASNVVPITGGSAGTAILGAVVGRWAVLVSDGTNWVTTEAGYDGREVLTTERTYYVGTTGSDLNNGLTSTSAFLTPQQAADVTLNAIDNAGWAVTIQIADGTAYGPMYFGLSQVGSGEITIRGNATTPANVRLNGASNNAAGLQVENGWRGFIRDLSLKAEVTHSTVPDIHCSGSWLGFANVIFDACNSSQIVCDVGGYVYCDSDYQIVGGGSSHFNASDGGLIQISGGVCTITGTPAFDVFVTAFGSGGIQHFSGATIVGTTTGPKFIFTENAVMESIDDATGAFTKFPGSSPGSVNSGATFNGITGNDAPSVKTANFTVDTGNFPNTARWFVNNKAATTCTVTLPAPSDLVGRELGFKTIQALPLASSTGNVVPIDGGSASTTIVSGTAGKWALLVSDGTSWITMQAG